MSSPANPNPPAPNRLGVHHWLLRVVIAAIVVLLLLALGAIWYANTPRFARFLRGKVISELQQATGGRVEMGTFQWSLLHLEFVVNNLTIHGSEAPGQLPYAHVNRLYVRARIISLFEQKIALEYFEADHPVIHLIVYPDGSTNQPHPKVSSTSKSTIDTIFNLQVNRAEIRDGVAIVNQRATPFNADANNLGLIISYARAKSKQPEHYTGKLHLEDLILQRGDSESVHSIVDAQATLQHNRVDLESLKLQTGDSQLNLSGALANFADPNWSLQAKGGVALSTVEALSGIPGINHGQVRLDLQGGGNKSKFEVNGSSSVRGASYHAGSIHLTGFSADTQLHLTQDEVKLTALRARLAKGGVIDGDVEIEHWMNAAPPPAAVPNLPPTTQRAKRKAQILTAKPSAERGTIHAHLHNLDLAAIMEIVAPPHFTELGFDTQASGDATVDWAGSASAFGITASVTLMPPLKTTPGRVPMYGEVQAKYSDVTGLVDIQSLDVHTPASEVKVTGSLGAYPITRGSNLKVNITTSNLAEFNPALTTLGVTANGKRGVNALPIALHGNADFNGTITQSILNPDIKGHVDASNFDLNISTAKLGARQMHWDSIHADAEVSSKRIAIANSVLTRGPASVNVSGELDAHGSSPQGWIFDERSAIRMNASVQNASAQDLLQLAGRSNIPVTGTLDLTAHASGTLDNLAGGGHVALIAGTAYGEQFKSLNTDFKLQGREIDAANLVFLEDGGRVTGDGGYNLKTAAFHFDARGTGFELAHFPRLQSDKYKLDGALAFEMHGSGTIHQPQVQANLHLTRLTINDTLKGYVDADAHTQGKTLILSGRATLANTLLQLHGQVQLAGNFETNAQLTVANFDVGPFLAAFHPTNVAAKSSIGATLNIHGPLRQPRKLGGDIAMQSLALTLAGINLKSDGSVHATLADGTLHLDPLHIYGEDTNLFAQGSVGALTDTHDMNLQARGSVNVKLAQSMSSNITSSGQVNFNVNAQGNFAHPRLTGDIQFADVSFALFTFPNGLSKMNGTLSFDQDRLDVKNLTAVSGGGKLTVDGFVTYQQGIYGDLTASAKGVRVRYPQGVSTMVDAKLRLQGTQQSSLLSGNVTITRFVVENGLALASFQPATMGLSLPPNPNALTNRIRLDVHVVSAPQLDFQNSYAKLAGYVDLRVRGTIAQPSVLGHISITEGNATFAGTKYELQHGDIYFSNPVRINPTLDLSATARVEDYDITVGLTGTAAKPVPTFRSEPPLSEQDIFSLLALGRTQEEQQIYSNMQSQAGVNSTADALLGGALNATLSSRIQKLFGGGSVKIDPTFVSGTGNATARITVQQQISKYATLTYATNVNSTAEQLIQAQVNLTRDFSVLAVRDEAGVFSLVFKLRRRYR